MKTQLIEAQNNALNKIRQFRECFGKKITRENLRLSERYVEGEIYALVCFMVPGNRVHHCALFHRGEGLRCRKINDLLGEGTWGEFDKSLESFFYPSGIQIKSHLGNDSCGSRQQTMLVSNVKSVEFPQTIIPSQVRLESVYSIFSRLGHTV